MKDLRGGAPMSETDLEVWKSNVDRLHHTITTHTKAMWFITRQGERFDVWHVDCQKCVDAYRAYTNAPSLDGASSRIQGGIRGYLCRRLATTPGS